MFSSARVLIMASVAHGTALSDMTQSNVAPGQNDEESGSEKKPIRRSRSFKKWFKTMKSPRKLKPSTDDNGVHKENFSPHKRGSVRRSMSLGNSKDASWKKSNSDEIENNVHKTGTSEAESVADTYINLVSAANNTMFEQQRHDVSQIDAGQFHAMPSPPVCTRGEVCRFLHECSFCTLSGKILLSVCLA